MESVRHPVASFLEVIFAELMMLEGAPLAGSDTPLMQDQGIDQHMDRGRLAPSPPARP
jgi:hypothetical protein